MYHISQVLTLHGYTPLYLLAVYRNLLPADNFSESRVICTESIQVQLTSVTIHLGYLTSAASDPLPSDSFSSENGRRNVSGFKIMTVTRGFTEEADKLLDYLVRNSRAYMRLLRIILTVVQENGIFDALQKQYLRSFIFAIYLVRLSVRYPRYNLTLCLGQRGSQQVRLC